MRWLSSLRGIVFFLLTLAVAASVTLAGGCGGQSVGWTNAPASAVKTGRATLTVRWPKRTRLIPFAAESIAVRIVRGATLLGEKLLTRPENGGNVSVTFDRLPIGDATVSAVAFPNADGSGIAQAEGSVPVTVLADTIVEVRLTLSSTINRLSVAPEAVYLMVGESVTPIATAYNDKNEAVLIKTTTLTWASDQPAVVGVEVGGKMTALAVGVATVIVTETESGKTASATLTVAAIPTPTPTPTPTPIPSADLLAYESFDYPVGSELNGQTGGYGFVPEGWTENTTQGSTPTKLVAGSLTYRNLKTAGNAAQSSSQLPFANERAVPNSVALVASGSVVYMSVLIRPVDPLNVGWPNTYFGITSANLFVGKGGDNDFWLLENIGGAGRAVSQVVVKPDETVFLVVRQTSQDGVDKIDLWVNPIPGQPLPAPDATKTDLDVYDLNVGIDGSIRCVYDEYRVGRTWESVSPTQ